MNDFEKIFDKIIKNPKILLADIKKNFKNN